MQQEVQRKEELSAAKVKMDRMMNELQEEYHSNLKRKDEEIQALKYIIAEQSQVCATHIDAFFGSDWHTLLTPYTSICTGYIHDYV